MGDFFIEIFLAASIVCVIVFSNKLTTLLKKIDGIKADINQLTKKVEQMKGWSDAPVADAPPIAEPVAAQPLVVKTEEKVLVEEVALPSVSPILDEARSDIPTEETIIPAELSEEVLSTSDAMSSGAEVQPLAEAISPVSEEISSWERSNQPVQPVVKTPVVTPRKEKKKVNYEKYIGENLFAKIGILVLVVGIGLFVKYAIDQDWINEKLRTMLGFLMGSALLFVAERVRKPFRVFSSLLAGGAFAIFYVTVAIAFHYYHIFSQPVAFVLLVAITLLMSLLAIVYDRRELAIISLVGGFVAPFLVSSGSGNYMVLFSYIALLNLGMFALSLYKKWAELPVISFFATLAVLGIYVFNTWVWDEVDLTALKVIATRLFGFNALFYITFLLPILSIFQSDSKRISRVLLSVLIANNFAFAGFGLLFLHAMQLPVKLDGLLTLLVAGVSFGLVFWLRKKCPERKDLVYTGVSQILTFISLTIPIQLNGNYITLFWASEVVILIWLYMRSQVKLYGYFAFLLVFATVISLGMDLYHLDSYYLFTETPEKRLMFLNKEFVTLCYTGLAFLAAALLMQYKKEFFEQVRPMGYNPWNALFLLGAVGLIYYAFMNQFDNFLPAPVAAKTMLLFTTGSIIALTLLLRKRFPIRKYAFPYLLAMGGAVMLYAGDVADYNTYRIRMILPVLGWMNAGAVTLLLALGARYYYAEKSCHQPQSRAFTIYLNILSGILLLSMVFSLLEAWRLTREWSAAFSVGLVLLGSAQMILGMRFGVKLLRKISLVTFSAVLIKLVLVDLWAMPTVGKIIVFVLLGVILLSLSFLYQKLKDVIFNDSNEVKKEEQNTEHHEE